MKNHPVILEVATGHVNPPSYSRNNLIDYRVYAGVPRWWRKLEELARVDLYLALRARALAKQYDLVLAHSEKVGIPLSFVRLGKPLVVYAHHLESPVKARFVRATGIVKQWAGIGYVSDESRKFIASYFGVPEDRLFEFEFPKHLKSASVNPISQGPIVSVGVAKRDYTTLLRALSELAGYETRLYISSRFGDQLLHRIGIDVPAWVHCEDYVPEDQLIESYRQARFVVVALDRTTQNSAGLNAIFEASAYGKAVIATRTGGTPSFVIDGETGILVPPYDVQAMRNAIRQLWTQPDLAIRMGLAGRRYMESRFDPDKIVAGIRAIFDKVYAESRAGGRE